MEGRGDNPMTFGKKSSPFGVSFVNPWRLSLPISQATKGSAMQCSFLNSWYQNSLLPSKISSRNPCKDNFHNFIFDVDK